MQVSAAATNIREAMDSMARVQATNPFLLAAETGASLSFEDMKRQSELLSSMLAKAGLQRGDKAAFLMDNGLLTAQLFLGCMYGGFVAVPLNVRAGASQLSYMLDHCDARIVFVEGQYTEMLREMVSGVRRDIRVIEVEPDGPLPAFESAGLECMPESPAGGDAAMLIYSSGSTGKPKGAIHTHRSVLAHGRNSIQAHQLSSSDRSLLVLPLYHINAECVTLIPTLLSGGGVVVAHRFDVTRFWDWVEEFRITWSALVPTIISELVDWDDAGKDRQAAFERIRFFRSSSAPLSPSLHQRFLDKFRLPLLQAMGSTECGNVFSNPVPPAANKIGSPGLVWGFESRIVDRHGADVPQGEPGEVLLRGEGLMQGYHKDREGTEAVVDGEGWLHTGDLARQDEDGYFFVVGRSKELIIKGGVNIAPRQIDEVLESHPAVLEAAAVGVPDRYFGEDAIAFVVLRAENAADERALMAFCETRLGHFKTPSRIHFLKDLPKGPSGKVQRLRLLDPAILAAVAPASQSDGLPGGHERAGQDRVSLEQIVAEAWAEVLGLPQVDANTNFFALGGHSLKAIQCLSKLREKLPIILSLSDFFESGTVAEQAELIRRRLDQSGGTGAAAEDADNWEKALLQQYVVSAEEAIPHSESTLPYPLSSAQQRLWFMEELNQSLPVYNEAEAVLLTGELNADALEQAMNVVVDRHEVLRSTIEVIRDEPHAVVHPSWPLRFKRIDLSALPQGKRRSEVDRLLIEEPRLRYDLKAAPGIRVTLIRVGAREHVLILMMHHIICDWSSEGIIWRELSAAYSAFLHGQTPSLPSLPVTHRDYAAWQDQTLATANFDKEFAFWEKTLSGVAPLLELPADRPRPPVTSHRGRRVRRKLSSEMTEALRNMSRRENTSPFTVFAAALNTLFYRYTGIEDILIGIPLADRDRRELQSVVGFLLHTQIMRTRLSGDITFRDLLSRVQKGVLDFYAHRSLPFHEIVRKLRPERNLSYSPLFQVMLNYRDRDQLLPFIGMEGLAIESLLASSDTSKFDLFWFVTDCGDEIWLELEYSTDLFDDDRIARMLNHYETLLAAAAAEPDVEIAKMPLLTAGEYRQTVIEGNQTERSYPADQCVDELITAQTERTPDAVAVSFKREQLTYRELLERANRLANHLRELGVERNKLVAVCLERSVEMPVALLAILKAGGAYLPLDPSFPPDRLAFMLRDAQPLVLLTEKNLRGALPPHSLPTVCVDEIPVAQPQQIQTLRERQSSDLAYVLYTSGSTGTPKGVQIQHRALANFLWSMRNDLNVTAKDSLLAITTLSFDIAGLELYLPLVVGARVVIASSEAAKDARQLAELIRTSRATVMQATPATWRMLLDAGWNGSAQLKILCGGEAWDAELGAKLLPRCESLWNMYGPTETTIWSAVARVEKGRPVAIGKPIANTTFYLLDRSGQPVPAGVPGELCIGGDGLALGYHGRPELTRERFIPDPFSTGGRLYKTGDLARRNADGTFEFLGRLDHQVKLRGFRIELGEIEAALQQCGGVRHCAVVVQGEGSGKNLVAYVVPADANASPSLEEMRSVLKQRLPAYMLPSIFNVVESMPLTANGKLDRKALAASRPTQVEQQATIDAPRDAIETKLIAIWEQLLETRPIGIRMNFFDIGGHSLLVVKLFAQMEKVFGRTLPIAAIFESPTIERLATLVRGESVGRAPFSRQARETLARANSTVVPLQPHGTGAPVFMVHGIEGHLLGFNRLAALTGGHHPIYGIQAQSLLPGRRALLRLEDQAAYYVSEIRKIQPHGPYHLLGYCFGGMMAFEMAQQLHAVGERVELLGMLDAWPRSQTARMREHDSLRTRLNRRKASFLAAFSRLSPAEKIAFLPQKAIARILRLTYSLAPALGYRTVPAFMKNPESLMRAAAKYYEPKPWAGTITLFRASVHSGSHGSRDMGWAPLAERGVEILEVPGDHFAIFGEHNITVLAERLRGRLEQCYPPALEHMRELA